MCRSISTGLADTDIVTSDTPTGLDTNTENNLTRHFDRLVLFRGLSLMRRRSTVALVQAAGVFRLRPGNASGGRRPRDRSLRVLAGRRVALPGTGQSANGKGAGDIAVNLQAWPWSALTSVIFHELK